MTVTREELLREMARKKARALRYKKPICKTTFEGILDELSEIEEQIGEYTGLLWDDDMLEELLGSEEDAFEFKMAFSDLQSECERMRDDVNALGELMYMDDDQAVATFDLFFPAAGDSGDMYGFDAYEGDYYRLDSDWERDEAHREALAKLKRLTKDQLMDVAGACLRIERQHLALAYRYDCLSAALDILQEKQNGLLQLVKEIEEAYKDAEYALENGFTFDRSVSRLDDALRNVPDRMWIE